MTIKQTVAITGICAVALLLSSQLFSTRTKSPQPNSTLAAQVLVSTAAPAQPANSKTTEASGPKDRWTYFRGNALSQGVANTTLPKKPVLLWKYEVPEGAFEVTAAIVDGVVYIDLSIHIIGTARTPIE